MGRRWLLGLRAAKVENCCSRSCRLWYWPSAGKNQTAHEPCPIWSMPLFRRLKGLSGEKERLGLPKTGLEYLLPACHRFIQLCQAVRFAAVRGLVMGLSKVVFQGNSCWRQFRHANSAVPSRWGLVMDKEVKGWDRS